MEEEVNHYVCPSSEEFQEILDGLFIESNGTEVNECQMKIDYMLSEEIIDLFGCCANAIEQPCATMLTVFNALIVLKRALSPTSKYSLLTVQKKWLSNEFLQSRNLTKHSVVYCLSHDHLAVRNEAAHCITLILLIEQEGWADLIPYLINTLKEDDICDSLKSGIISTFKEIFSYPWKLFCFKTIPNELFDFFQFLLFQISYPGLDQDKYIDCAICLESMICQIPNFFMKNNDTVKNINDILDALESTFQYSEEKLYRKFHHIMLAILREYYELSDEFMERIAEFALKGLYSNFRSVSIDFWCEVYKLEKNRNKQFKHTLIASEKLTRTLLEINLELKDPEQTNYVQPDITDWNHYSCKLLKMFVKAALISDPNIQYEATQLILSDIFDFLQFCVDDAEKEMPTLLAFISVMSSICTRNNPKELNEVLFSNFGFILECCHHPLERVSVNSLMLLNKFIKKDYDTLSSPELAAGIFNTVFDQIHSENEQIIAYLIRIMKNCCINFPIDANIYYYDDYMRIVNEMMSSDFILNCWLNGKAYSILTQYFISFINVDTKSHDLTDIMQRGQSWLDEATNYLVTSFGLMVNSLDTLQTEIYFFIGMLIKLLEEKANDLIGKIIEIMLKILNSHPNFIEETFSVLTVITYKNHIKILESIQQIFDLIEFGFNTESPIIIGESALLIGSLFGKLKTQGIPYLESNTSRLFELLNDPNVDNKRDYYGNVVLAVALIIEGVGKQYFPNELKENYIGKLIELSHSRFDVDDYNEMEEISRVFIGVAYGFYVILKVYGDYTIFNSKGPRRNPKNEIVEFLIYVGKNNPLIVNQGSILNYLKLIKKFVILTKSIFNIKLNSTWVKRIIEIGKNSDDEKCKKKAYFLLETIEKI